MIAPLVLLLSCSHASPSNAGLNLVAELDLTRQQVLAKYGGHARGPCLCYSDGRLFADFCEDEDDESHRMWRVSVATSRTCASYAPTNVELERLRTPNGVRVGDPLELLIGREGSEYSRITPGDLRQRREGPLTAEELSVLGDAEYQFSRRGRPVLSVYVRNGRVSGIAAWISESE